jgi:hypothetical protein
MDADELGLQGQSNSAITLLRFVGISALIGVLVFLSIPVIPSENDWQAPMPWPALIVVPFCCAGIYFLSPRAVNPRWLLPLVLWLFTWALLLIHYALNSQSLLR